MSQPNRISFAFIAAVLIADGVAAFGGVAALGFVFLFCLHKLDFLKHRGKWAAITIFLAMLAVAAYGLAFFVQATVYALPAIAEKSLPAIIQWAAAHQISPAVHRPQQFEG